MDDIDRRLIGLLQHDASQTYAKLAAQVHLSPGATHDRVRKLREGGVILRTTVEIAPALVGRAVLAFVLLETDGWVTDAVAAAAVGDQRVEDLHTVAGDANFIVKLRVADPAELQQMLRALFDIKGVRRTRTLMVLDTYIDRAPAVGPQLAASSIAADEE